MSCSHKWGAQRHILFGPAPWGPREGQKGQISLKIIKFQLQSQFQRFLNQTLCVFSEMKDIKQIRRDFHLVAWVMPQGWTWRYCGGLGGSIFFFPRFNQIWCVSYLHECHMQRHHFLGPRPLEPWEGAKRSNIIKSELQSISKIFKPNFVYLLTNERYITYQTGFSFGCLGYAQRWDLVVPWGVGFFFPPKFSQIWCVSYLYE